MPHWEPVCVLCTLWPKTILNVSVGYNYFLNMLEVSGTEQYISCISGEKDGQIPGDTRMHWVIEDT